MKNSKIIVINGFARGGTNILWNILQSHPEVCSSLYETGEILYPRSHYKLQRYLHRFYWRYTKIPVIHSFIAYLVDARLYSFKMQNLDDPDNRYKLEGIQYSKEEVSTSTLCMKSIDNDVYLTHWLDQIYEQSYFVGLIRNGYAICEGWVRRGFPAESIGRLYRDIGQIMIEDCMKMDNYRIVRFEDLLVDPFGQAFQLYQFAELSPLKIEKLRLKSKKILTQGGEHTTQYGQENTKYWFSRDSINQILDSGISSRQENALAPADRAKFEQQAYDVLAYFGYLGNV